MTISNIPLKYDFNHLFRPKVTKRHYESLFLYLNKKYSDL